MASYGIYRIDPIRPGRNTAICHKSIYFRFSQVVRMSLVGNQCEKLTWYKGILLRLVTITTQQHRSFPITIMPSLTLTWTSRRASSVVSSRWEKCRPLAPILSLSLLRITMMHWMFFTQIAAVVHVRNLDTTFTSLIPRYRQLVAIIILLVMRMNKKHAYLNID